MKKSHLKPRTKTVALLCLCILLSSSVLGGSKRPLDRFLPATASLSNQSGTTDSLIADQGFSDLAAGEVYSTNSFDVTYKGSALWNEMGRIAYQGSYAYVAATNGLMIFDMSDPSEPSLVSKTFIENGEIWDIAIFGSYVYLTSEWQVAVYIIDVSDVFNPEIVGRYNSYHGSYGIVAIQNWVYLGGGTSIKAVNVSDPKNPILGDEVSSGVTLSLIVRGDYLFAAARDIAVYDISDRSKLLEIARIETPRDAYSMAFCQNVLAVVDESNMWPAFESTLQLVDITDPTNPALGSSLNLMGDGWSISTDDNYVYYGGDRGIYIVEIVSADSLVNLGHFQSPGATLSLEVQGDILFASTTGGIGILNPLVPTCSDIPESKIVPAGDALVIDVSDRTSPCLFGEISDGMEIYRVATHGEFAYLSGSHVDSTLGIVDGSSSDSLTDVELFDIDIHVNDLGIANDLLYVAAAETGIQIYDLIDPASPSLISTLPLPGVAWEITIEGTLLFVAAHEAGIFIVDVSNPYDPSIVGEYDTPDYAQSIAVENNFAYVADRYNGLVILDITDVGQPVFAGGYSVSNGSTSLVKVRDSILFMNGEGLVALDVSNPAEPKKLSSVIIYSWFNGLAVDWDAMQLIVSNGMHGLVFVDATDLTNLQINGRYNTPGTSYRFVVDDNFIWLADGHSVIRLGLPVATTVKETTISTILPSHAKISSVYPNPFNLETTILVELPERGNITLDVYNVLGKKVRRIFDGDCSAGHHRFVWNGQGDDGQTVSSGVYFSKLRFNNESTSQKMLLLK